MMDRVDIAVALKENFDTFVRLRADQNANLAKILRVCQRQLSNPNADRGERMALLGILPQTIALLEGGSE